MSWDCLFLLFGSCFRFFLDKGAPWCIYFNILWFAVSLFCRRAYSKIPDEPVIVSFLLSSSFLYSRSQSVSQSNQSIKSTMNINQETGEVENVGRSPRFTLWVAFLFFATVTMISSVEVKNKRDEVDGNAKWAVFCSAFTFVITIAVNVLHMSPGFSHLIVNTRVEGGVITLLTAFWATTVSIVSNANTGLAVDSTSQNTVVNGNLYYFSWAGFVTSVMLLVAYLRAVFGVDLASEIKNRAARLTLWSAMLACALVVMGSSANVFDKDCSTSEQTHAFCARTKFAISLGAISTIASLAVVGMKMATSIAPFLMEAALALFLAIFNGFGVAFITSAKGPGSPIGNLYYFTWLSFLCSFLLCASCYEDYSKAGTTDESNDDNKGPGDIQIENLDDSNI